MYNIVIESSLDQTLWFTRTPLTSKMRIIAGDKLYILLHLYYQ